MIERTTHSENFTIVDNSYLKDTRLSLKAKGLFTVMLSVSPSWEFSISGFASLFKEGRDSISSALAELEDCGYLERCGQSRDKSGKMAANIWIVREKPNAVDAPLLNNPAADNPATIVPATKNDAQLSTNELTTNRLITNSRLSLGDDGAGSGQSGEGKAVMATLAENGIVADQTEVAALCAEVGTNTVLASIRYAVNRGAAHWGYVKKVAATGGPKRKARQATTQATNADSGDEVAAALASDIAKMYASWRTTQDSANCGGNYHTVKEREG